MSEQEKQEKNKAESQTMNEAEAVAEPVAATAGHPGRGLAILALLVALGACGGGYWLWTQLQQQRDDSAQMQQQLTNRLDNIDTAQKLLANELDQTGSQVAALRNDQKNLTDALSDINQRLGRNREAWVLAEAEYLLAMGNRRLQLARDAAGAAAALSAADQRLASLGDPLLTPVRAKISDELQALRAVPKVDVDGISLELGSLAKAVDMLPIAGAPHVAAAPALAAQPKAAGGWRGFIASLWGDLRSLVVVRHHQAGKLPLLTPDQRDLLRENMRLKLETARLALLQRREPVYRAALQEADAWLTRYFEAGAAATQAAHATLTRLAATVIAPPLPSIDASLRDLRAVSDSIGGGEKAPAAKGRRP